MRKTEMDGITVYRSELRGLPMCVKPNARRWVSGVRKMFARYVKLHGKPDIIHAHCVKWAGYAASLISEEYDIPFVITEHLSSMIYAREFKGEMADVWQIPLLRGALKKADMVIPVSAELVDDLSVYFGKDYRWQSVSNMIDTDFYLYRQREPREGRPLRFGCLANYDPRKGYDVLFDAFDMFNMEHPDAELHIAGNDTKGAECIDEIKRHSSASRIFPYGVLDKHKVLELLYRCDCLILATRNEAQGLVLFESMSTGIPAITTDCVPMNVRIEGGCFIFPVDDARALYDMMNNVMSAEGIDGKALSTKVADVASPSVIGKKIEQVFEDVLRRRY